MTVALPINSNSVRHFNQSVAVHPFMYCLLQRAGVPLLSPGQRLKGRVVVTDFPARAHSPLDEVLELGVEPGSSEIKAKVKRVDALLYPAPGWPQRANWELGGFKGLDCADAAALIQGQRCPFPKACACYD